MCYAIPFVVGFYLSFCILFMSCISYHVIMCISLHTCSSHASEHFPRCPFCNPALLCPPAFPFCLFSCAGVKRSRNGPSLAKWPWYTTGRPPVKFRSIWRSFGTPTVNRASAKSICVLQQNPLKNQPKTHQTLFHAVGRSITIVWAKTAPYLEPPSSLYLFICEPSRKRTQIKP